MAADAQPLDRQSIIKLDDRIAQVHGLLVEEMLAGSATARVQAAEQQLHDLRNEFAALTGLGFRFAACQTEPMVG